LQFGKKKMNFRSAFRQRKALSSRKAPTSQKVPCLASSSGNMEESVSYPRWRNKVRAGQPLLKQLNCQQLWVDAFVNIDALQNSDWQSCTGRNTPSNIKS
jgi:hypothetical protein